MSAKFPRRGEQTHSQPSVYKDPSEDTERMKILVSRICQTMIEYIKSLMQIGAARLGELLQYE